MKFKVKLINYLNEFPLSYLIGIFIFDQLINSIFNTNLLAQTIYPSLIIIFENILP